MRLLFTTLALLLGSFLTTFAQTPSWQWGKRGGSNTSNENEPIKGIATDPNGNVYILSQVRYSAGGSATLDVAGNPVIGKGSKDVMLSSFTCNGTYRWSKVFGGALASDVPSNLQTDSLGGVYLTGIFNNWNSTVQLASDTTLTTQSARFMYMIKYDTAGNYKWVVRPQSDTTHLGDNSGSYGLQVDGGGNIYWLAHLKPNYYSNNYQVNTISIHVLKYNKSGIFQGGIPLDVVSDVFPVYFQSIFFTRSKTGRFYLSGEANSSSNATLSFGSTNITKQMFVGAFSSTGTSLWTKQSSFDRNAFKNSGMDRVSLDDSGNVYVAANCSHGDAFAGSAPILNTITGIEELAFAAKLDSNGLLKWLKNSSNTYNSYVQDSRAALTSDGKFVLAAALIGTVTWPGLSSSITSTDGATASRDFLITRIDGATGQVLSMDTLASVGPTTNVPDIAYADKKGNVYFGGQMDKGVVVNGTSIIAAPASGYATDFFLAKYGYSNCNCVPPTAAITQSNFNNASRSVTFQYSGSTAGVDSVVWTWGNSQAPVKLTGGLMTSPIQRFYGVDTGTYNVCVTAYTNGCGSNKVCTVLRFTPLGVGELGVAGGERLQLAPNPAITTTEVTYSLQGSNGSLEVYDLVGRLLSRKVLSGKTGTEILSLTDYVAGVYMVVLREEGREAVYRRLVVGE